MDTKSNNNELIKIGGATVGIVAGAVITGSILTAAGITSPLGAYVIYAGIAYGAKKGYQKPDSVVFPFLNAVKIILGGGS